MPKQKNAWNGGRLNRDSGSALGLHTLCRVALALPETGFWPPFQIEIPAMSTRIPSIRDSGSHTSRKASSRFPDGLRLRLPSGENARPVIQKTRLYSFNPNRSLDTPCPFLIGEMRLSGILPASVRILFLATPRRSPLRLRLGEKHAADTSGQSPQCLMTDLGLFRFFPAMRDLSRLRRGLG